jgi:hypothetical protein
MNPIYISEIATKGSYVGTGPHSIATSLPAPAPLRAAVTVALIVSDSTTDEIYYVSRTSVVKYDDTNLTVGTPVVAHAAVGWSGGTVVIGASIVDDEVIGSLTIPDGYTVNIAYRVDGLTT